jgi:CO dehydrogenase/acetyl-CoA synthase delta subunit
MTGSDSYIRDKEIQMEPHKQIKSIVETYKQMKIDEMAIRKVKIPFTNRDLVIRTGADTKAAQAHSEQLQDKVNHLQKLVEAGNLTPDNFDGEDEDTTGDTEEVVAGQQKIQQKLETPEERKKREALEAARDEGLYKLWRGF